jgi:hypothetical protein
MTTMTTLKTLAHAMAALDEFPILGAMQVRPDNPGVDFDSLERMRTMLPEVWNNAVPADEIRVTGQAGLLVTWSKQGWEMQMLVDPYALTAFRVDSPFGINEWTRPSTDASIADAKSTLAVMAQENRATGLPGAPQMGDLTVS